MAVGKLINYIFQAYRNRGSSPLTVISVRAWDIATTSGGYARGRREGRRRSRDAVALRT